MKNPSQTLEPNFILFGGAFDPPHNGHHDCIKLTQQRFPEADICIVPSLMVPASRLETKPVQASFDDRMEMCRIAFADLVKAPQILDVERHLPTPSYTIQTMGYLHKKFPDKRLGFIIGLDQMNKLHSWLKPLKVLELASLVLISRDEIHIENALHDLSRNLGIPVGKFQDSRIELGNYKPAFFISNPTTPISSSKIRQILKDLESMPDSAIDPKVLQYIHKKKLYSK